MDAEQVEAIGHRLLEAMTRRDFAMLAELLDPEVRLRSLITRMGRDFTGFDGLRRYFSELDESFEGVSWQFHEVVAVEDDVAVVRSRFRARGRGSGIEIDEVHAAVWRFRDGRGIVNDVHMSLDEALAAAGLRA